MKKNKIFFTQSTAFLTGILGISLGIIDKINTSDSLSYFISIFKEPWFLQGMLVNASFTICSIPLSPPLPGGDDTYTQVNDIGDSALLPLNQ